MFSSHPRIRKRNFRVSVNDSINCSDHCFRSHNKDGACMETFPHIHPGYWMVASHLHLRISPSIVSGLDMVLSAPRDVVRMSLKMATSHQYSAYILHQFRILMSCCEWLFQEKHQREHLKEAWTHSSLAQPPDKWMSRSPRLCNICHQ